MPLWSIVDNEITVMDSNHILQVFSLSILTSKDSNILAFNDMPLKKDYLVCATSDSIFRAVNRNNNLTAWSTVTGKRLYYYQLASEASIGDVQNFEPFYRMTGQQNKHLEYNSRLLIAKKADAKGNYILKFVELDIEEKPGAVKTLCTFKLDHKPDNTNDTFVYCKKLDAVLGYNDESSLVIYTKPVQDDDCWVKGEVD